MSKETVRYCKANKKELYTTDINVKNSVIVGRPMAAMYRFQNYMNHYTMWTQRDDLDWILKIKNEAKEFIEASGGFTVVTDEFCAYEHPNIYKEKNKIQVVAEWIKGLPLAMPNEDNSYITKKMKEYGYDKDEPVEDYYEIFSVFIADTVFAASRRKFSYDWSRFTKGEPKP